MIFLLLACAVPEAEDSCVFEDVVDDAIEGEDLDCGAVGDGEDGSAQWACAVAAWQGNEPFQLRWESYGIDSRSLSALLGDGSRLWRLTQDQEDYGSWDVDGRECIDPYELPDDDGTTTVIGCASLAPTNTHYDVCSEGKDHGSPEALPWPN